MKLRRLAEEAPSGPNGTERPQERKSRPKIRVQQKLTEMTDRAIQAIADRPDLSVYVRGGMLDFGREH